MNARLLELAEQSGIAKVLNQHAWEFGSGKFELDHYPELTKFAELVIAAYTPPPHPIYLASDGRFYEIPQRQKPLPESEVNEMYREMFCVPKGKTLTHQNWFQAGVAWAENAHGIR